MPKVRDVSRICYYIKSIKIERLSRGPLATPGVCVYVYTVPHELTTAPWLTNCRVYYLGGGGGKKRSGSFLSSKSSWDNLPWWARIESYYEVGFKLSLHLVQGTLLACTVERADEIGQCGLIYSLPQSSSKKGHRIVVQNIQTRSSV